MYSFHRLIRLSDAGAHLILLDERLDINTTQVSCRGGSFQPLAAVFLFVGIVMAVPSLVETKDWLYTVLSMHALLS